MLQPEVGRFWGPRFGEITDESAEKRYKEFADSNNSVNWTIAYLDEPVGFTGIFDIDWVRRDGESGIFIGRHDLFGRGIASEAIRLRTDFAWRELRLHRVHNWVAHANRGSRRAKPKSRQLLIAEQKALRRHRGPQSRLISVGWSVRYRGHASDQSRGNLPTKTKIVLALPSYNRQRLSGIRRGWCPSQSQWA